MANITVVGAQWGDEGKGKIVDMLADRADMVVRFHGGHNAGHTVVVGDKVFKISILPSGIIRPAIVNVIGNGVVLSPGHLFSELAALRANGVVIQDENLIIADNTALLLPVHAAVDAALESGAGARIGTTKRGIGQAYQDKVGRRAIRVVDLKDQEIVDRKVDAILDHWNPVLEKNGAAPYPKEMLLADIERHRADLLRLSSANVPEMIEWAMQQGANILFEGAQGTLLDVDHGTYPYVTSSSTVSSAVGSGVGLGPKTCGHVLGIIKAYTTRVGLGPFPSAMEDDMARHVAGLGKELGTVTGRPRDCGWLDLVALKKAVRLNGIDSLAITKIDVLDHLTAIQVVVGYALNGKEIRHFPNSADELGRVTPVYRELPGWQADTTGVRSYEDLPVRVKEYIAFVEDALGVPVSIVSVGADRAATIERSVMFNSGLARTNLRKVILPRSGGDPVP
jgi:adenylosuccinate synthase